MKAMISAAGCGERMRPLTDGCPKPLLQVGKELLIGWHLCRLKRAGITEIVINHARLGEKIEETLGNGHQYGAKVPYSPERSGGLETAGGIVTALPLLGDEPFLIVNGDILTDIDFQTAFQISDTLIQQRKSAYLWLVSNLPHNPNGDLVLDSDGRIYPDNKAKGETLIFSGMGVCQSILFKNTLAHQIAKLAPLLCTAMNSNSVIGGKHNGLRLDVGIVERFEAVNKLAENW